MRVLKVLPSVLACLLIPMLAFASSEAHGGGHHETNWVYVGSLFFNLIAFIVLMFILLKKPVSAFFADRSRSIEEQLKAAEIARKEAEAKIKEYGSKIDELLSTREEVLASAKKEAEGEKERIVEAARRQARRILEDADRSVNLEVDKAVARLSEETAAGIAKEAERLLREAMTSKDDMRLADDYIDMLREVKGS